MTPHLNADFECTENRGKKFKGLVIVISLYALHLGSSHHLALYKYSFLHGKVTVSQICARSAVAQKYTLRRISLRHRRWGYQRKKTRSNRSIIIFLSFCTISFLFVYILSLYNIIVASAFIPTPFHGPRKRPSAHIDILFHSSNSPFFPDPATCLFRP